MPVIHVLHNGLVIRYLKAPKDGLLDSRGSLWGMKYDPVPSSKPFNVVATWLP